MDNSMGSLLFQEYGSIYDATKDSIQGPMKSWSKKIKGTNLQPLFYQFDYDAYIEVQSGTGILLVSNDPHTEPIKEFMINRPFRVKTGVYFSIVSASAELQVDLRVSAKYSLKLASPNRPYQCRLIYPQVQVTEFFGYYLDSLASGHGLSKARHPFYELIFVDNGVLYAKVDNKDYVINEKEIIILAPGQKHALSVPDNESASYVTIQFQMQMIGGYGQGNLNQGLLNKVFPHNRKVYDRIKSFSQETATVIPYLENLMVCMLTEILIRLLQSGFVEDIPTAKSIIRHNYQDELFNRIVAYINERIYDRITIDELCKHFSISRSSIQHMFINAVNQTPKRYISDLKLEKSCQLLRENKYSVIDIAKKLGYNSVQNFTHNFTQKYHISPGEYAKRIY